MVIRFIVLLLSDIRSWVNFCKSLVKNDCVNYFCLSDMVLPAVSPRRIILPPSQLLRTPYAMATITKGTSFLITAEDLPTGFPMITQAPTTKVVEMGHNAVLLCAAVGSPPPIISWVRDMLPIDTSNPRYTVLETGK